MDHSGFGSIKIRICQDSDLSGFGSLRICKVPIFPDNTSGHGQSYEDWWLIFANNVGKEFYEDDCVMGKWLKGLLHQEIANDVEMVLGLDESGASIYRFLFYLRPGYSLARQYLCVSVD